jgi:hypothetical protein
MPTFQLEEKEKPREMLFLEKVNVDRFSTTWITYVVVIFVQIVVNSNSSTREKETSS